MERPLTTEEIEDWASKNAKAPRVSVTDIEQAIFGVFYQTGDHLLDHSDIRVTAYKDTELYERARLMTVCTIMMKNGFMVIGHSTPASAENYNFDLGKKLAYDQAFKQLWPLMGFVLKTRQMEGW
jgi:hypothetical protein